MMRSRTIVACFIYIIHVSSAFSVPTTVPWSKNVDHNKPSAESKNAVFGLRNESSKSVDTSANAASGLDHPNDNRFPGGDNEYDEITSAEYGIVDDEFAVQPSDNDDRDATAHDVTTLEHAFKSGDLEQNRNEDDDLMLKTTTTTIESSRLEIIQEELPTTISQELTTGDSLEIRTEADVMLNANSTSSASFSILPNDDIQHSYSDKLKSADSETKITHVLKPDFIDAIIQPSMNDVLNSSLLINLNINNELEVSSENTLNGDVTTEPKPSVTIESDLSQPASRMNFKVKREGISPGDQFDNSNPLATTKFIQNVNEIDLPKNDIRRKPGQSSLVIVFDGTGSMENCLVQLRAGAKLIIEKFAKSDVNPIYNYVFVPFRDPDTGPELVTTDHEELFHALDHLKLGGGGDCPESALTGILSALTLALPKSYVYIFTDAIAKDFAMDGKVLELVRKKQTTLTFLLTGFCNSKDFPGYKVFERLASASNGQVYNLREQDISEVINDIKNSLDKKRVALKYMDSPVAETHSFDISIDENLKEFSVSVAGLHPNITILDPNKKNYMDGKASLNLENLKVLNVQNPIPGDWNIVAGSDSSHSVRLTALSDVMFNFGFSLHEPTSIGDTLFNPLRGENNIFTIAASDTALINNLTAIRITLHYDNEPPLQKPEKAISFKLDLHPIRRNGTPDGTGDSEFMFATKPFEPPRRAFKIEISGFDKFGNPLQRLLSTIVQSTDESAPEVFLDSSTIDVRQMENITLKCVAQSLVPMMVQWKLGDEVLLLSEVDQSTTLTYDIVNAEVHQSGLYACHAKNRKGFAESFINVKVRPHDLRVQMKHRNYSATEHDPVVSIECEISPKDALVEWSFNETPLECIIHARTDDPAGGGNLDNGYECRDTVLHVWNVTRHQAGVYRCHGRTAYESKFAEASLTVLRPTRLRDPHYQNLPAAYGDSLKLTCDADGVPEPSVSWTLHKWNTSQQRIVGTAESSTIEIEGVREEDEGIYICSASNGVGEPVRRTVRVFGVASDPPTIHPPPASVIEAHVGSDVRLTCACSRCEPLTAHSWSSVAQLTASLSANNPQSANMHLDVHRPWSTTSADDNSTAAEPRNYAEFVLSITNVTAENEGAYQCRLSNEHSAADGVDSAMAQPDDPSMMEVFVKVLVPPLVERITVTGAVPNRIDESSGKEAVVIRGKVVSIVCAVKGSPSPSVRWSNNGVALIESNRIRVTKGTVVIAEILNEDEGEYMCQADNHLGVAVATVNVRVVVPPSLVSGVGNDSASHLVESVEGQHVQLPCSVSGRPEPTVSWFIDGHRLDITNSKYVSSNSTLGFQASGSDSGIYECRATNEFGTVSQQSTLLIYGEHLTSMGNQAQNNEIVEVRSIGSSSGARVTTICKETGYRLLNGDQIASDTRNSDLQTRILICQDALALNVNDSSYMLVKIVDNNPMSSAKSITILAQNEPTWGCRRSKGEASPNHRTSSISANFNCHPTAANEHVPTNATKSLAIRVIKPPQLLQFRHNSTTSAAITYDPHKRILLGTPLELICPYENHNKLNWLKNNQPLVTTIRSGETASTSNSATPGTTASGDDVRPHWRPDGRLSFDRVGWTDAGNYSCWVENEAGRANFSYRLDVMAAPRRIGVVDRRLAGASVPENREENDDDDGGAGEDGSTELTVAVGEKVLELDCVAVGNPAPTIKWLRNDRLISDDKLLRILNPGIDDSGHYSCRAQNELGTASRSYRLTVTSAPTLLAGPDSDLDNVLEKNIDDRLVLNCTMEANPEPKYAWTKNGLPLAEYGPIHVIDQVDTSHEALYKCNALNAFGQQQVTFDVTVVAPPTVRLDGGNRGETMNTTKTHIDPSPLVLRCSASGAPTPIVSWTLNGRTVLTTARVHDDLLTNGNRVIHLDEHGNRLLGTDDFDDAQPRINQSLATVASTAPQRDRYGQVQKLEALGGVSISLVLAIGAAAKKVSGDYSCSAINAIGRDERVVRVNVLEPPKFRKSGAQLDAVDLGQQPTQIATLAGQPVILSCLASGRPQPQLYWFRGDTNLSANTLAVGGGVASNVRIMNTGKMLTVLQTSARDSGVYTCLAKSPAGESSTRFNVSVLEPPAIWRKPPSSALGDNRTNNNPTTMQHGEDDHDDITEEIIVKQGDSLLLHCPVSGRPMPAVTWLRLHYGREDDDEGGVRHEYREERLQPSAVEPNKLDIQSIDEPATFKCFANSSLGEIKLLFHISLNRPPKFDEPGPLSAAVLGVRSEETQDDEAPARRLNVKLHHGFTLECPVAGEPEPNVTWYMNDEMIAPQSDENVFISSNGHILRVNAASRDEAGRYMCMATNTLGVISRKFDVGINVTVHWSPWTGWTKCNAPCGLGTRKRSRLCLLSTGKPAQSDDAQCDGPTAQEEPCQIYPCPINGVWSEWDLWSECSNSCIEENDIESVRQRIRRCDSPAPRFGGRECAGRDHQTEICDVPHCPVHGRWSNWDDWSECSEACGNGTRVRRRSCDNPEPEHGGSYCEGETTETARCFVKSCSIHGGWSDWSSWSSCSQTCGRGQKFRNRDCNSPKPANGGRICAGSSYEMKLCRLSPCRSENLVRSSNKAHYSPYMTIVNPLTLERSQQSEDDEGSEEEIYETKGKQFWEDEHDGDAQEILGKATVTVTQEIPIADDIMQMTIHRPHGLSPIMITNPTRVCETGFEFVQTRCLDVNECSRDHGCSHLCTNTYGSYRCSCPVGWDLSSDKLTCVTPGRSHHYEDDRRSVVSTRMSAFDDDCQVGYELRNGLCRDTDECVNDSHGCSSTQTCLNTKGSYLCIPSPCPAHYHRVDDATTQQCVQRCSGQPKRRCSDGAQIAQMISYIVVSVHTIDPDVPIAKLASNDLDGQPLDQTEFAFADRHSDDAFVLETSHRKPGVVLVYAKDNSVHREKLYTITVGARSFGDDGSILYITKYVLHVYVG